MSVGIPRRSRVITSPASSRVIDETSLHGIYGFELKERVNTPEALIELPFTFLVNWFEEILGGG